MKTSGKRKLMIYHVTYLSGGLKVKGYLGIPPEFVLQGTDVCKMIANHFGTADIHLPVTVMAASVDRGHKQIKSEKLPVFLYCRGGMGKIGRVKLHWIEQFAAQGYVVFAPSYRGNEGGEGRDEFGGAEQEDVESAISLLRSLPFVDSNRISVMGFSRGAINAARTAAENTGIYKLVLWSGVSDLAQTYEERIDLRRMLKRLLGGTPSRNPAAYLSRSPLHMADRIRCPVLIMHGTEDRQVDYSHGRNMYAKLKQSGAKADMHSYQGYGHHFPLPIHEAAVERMFDWLKE